MPPLSPPSTSTPCMRYKKAEPFTTDSFEQIEIGPSRSYYILFPSFIFILSKLNIIAAFPSRKPIDRIPSAGKIIPI